MAFMWKQDPEIVAGTTEINATMWNEIITNAGTIKTAVDVNPLCSSFTTPCNTVQKTSTYQTSCSSHGGSSEITPIAQADTIDSAPVCSSYNRKTSCPSDIYQGVPGGAWSAITVTPTSVVANSSEIEIQDSVDTARGVIDLADQLHTSSYCTVAKTGNRDVYYSSKRDTVYGTRYATYQGTYDSEL